jgi:glycosyltransferase involved in cell wall biosynthesis
VARAAGRRIQLAGPLSDRAYFDARVAPLLGEDARYAGHLDTAALVALVGSSAAMLVTPVWDEPYGLVAAESLACGTPVLGFARGGLPEVVDDSCARLVQCDASGDADPENAVAGLAAEAAAVQAAAALVEDVVRLDRGAARERAVTACSLDTMVDDYLQMYAEMAPEPAFA